MPRKSLKELAKNPNLIPGIYNYCDRWCERCQFTARCLTYLSEQEDKLDAEEFALHPELLVEKLHESFAETKAMLLEIAEEHGIDLEAVAQDEELDREIHAAQEKAHHNPLVKMAEHYVHAVQHWKKTELNPIMTPASEEGVSHDLSPLLTDEAVVDALEIIQWYQFSIAATLYSAIHQIPMDEEDEVWGKEQQQQANGTSKVALLAMDQSILAWSRLQTFWPEKANSIQPLRVQLETLRCDTEAAFPEARAFLRPGFDEVTEYVM